MCKTCGKPNYGPRRSIVRFTGSCPRKGVFVFHTSSCIFSFSKVYSERVCTNREMECASALGSKEAEMKRYGVQTGAIFAETAVFAFQNGHSKPMQKTATKAVFLAF